MPTAIKYSLIVALSCRHGPLFWNELPLVKRLRVELLLLFYALHQIVAKIFLGRCNDATLQLLFGMPAPLVSKSPPPLPRYELTATLYTLSIWNGVPSAMLFMSTRPPSGLVTSTV